MSAKLPERLPRPMAPAPRQLPVPVTALTPKRPVPKAVPLPPKAVPLPAKVKQQAPVDAPAVGDDIDGWMNELGLPTVTPPAEESSSDDGSETHVPMAEEEAEPERRSWASMLPQAPQEDSVDVEQQQEEADFQAAIQASLRPAGPPPLLDRQAADEAEAEDDAPATGLQNNIGEYNCFLNVILQCLWRCHDFQAAFMEQDPAFAQAHPIVAALLQLFEALADQEARQQQQLAGALQENAAKRKRRVVDPSVLREALADVDGGRPFRLGEMNDAAEVLAALYDAMAHVPGGTQLVDDCFGMRVQESVYCAPCAKHSHKTEYTQHFFNASATALRLQLIAAQFEDEQEMPSLAALLRLTEQQHQKSCDKDIGGCGELQSPQHMLVGGAPRVFALQLAWERQQEAVQDINDTMSCIQEDLDLSEVFVGTGGSSSRYQLRSMVGFYGAHYSALVCDHGQWLMVDDTLVRPIGTWGDVLRTCQRGHIQPSVLFFESV
ncbi:hypothetical protein WJX73_000629 [Symbiochloris irregularis]|uniref:USP domain-containing protein n=1 Tax=Symbiochloris irregularis TaxID=706552 RepID=A0AAW1P7F8_9CHLO